jgi:hypothetical protein
MCRRFVAPALVFAAVTMVAFAPGSGSAQGQLPQPPVGFKPPPPPPPAPVKPYDPVPITPAGPFGDPSFAAFRKNLAAIAQHKERVALAKLVVAQNFFWLQDKNLADKSKPGVDNLAKAIDLDNRSGAGWDILTSDAGDLTLAEMPQSRGLFCAPAPPTFDPHAFEALVQQTGTDPTDWAYPSGNGAEMRAAAQPNARVVDKLGMYFVRVLPDNTAVNGGPPPFVHVALPNGKAGYVSVDDVVALANDQICYTKETDGWKIAGYIGGVQP